MVRTFLKLPANRKHSDRYSNTAIDIQRQKDRARKIRNKG